MTYDTTVDRRANDQCNTLVTLRNRLHRFADILHVDGPFTIADCPGHPDRADHLRDQLSMLAHFGAVETLGTEHVNIDTGTTIRTEYRWKPAVRDALRQYLDERNDLPCGHRAHVYNSREVPNLGCKYCEDDGDYPNYTRETVRRCLE